MKADFFNAQRAMQQGGIRRLLVLSGSALWALSQAQRLSEQLAGDWLWVSDAAPAGRLQSTSGAIRSLLGGEYLHGIFDARFGLDVEALAVQAGMLQAGSWLLLLVPDWERWPDIADRDSLRWSEQPVAMATPYFIRHLKHHLQQDREVVIWRQGSPLVLQPQEERPCWQRPSGAATPQQREILQQLRQMKRGTAVLTAPRGRGKSTLAGMLAAEWPGRCWVCAPAKAATDVLLRYAGELTEFWAPDALLERCRQQRPEKVDWLLIDEAAAIPLPLLRALTHYFPRVLMTTTVQGYEGSGRGFLLKFCATLTQRQSFSLSQPMRWASGDALERVLDNALLLNELDEWETPPPDAGLVIRSCRQSEWLRQPQRLAHFYALLTSAHYRTTPLDLRRIMDAPGMHFAIAQSDDGAQTVGALWAVDEGGLTPALAHEVWAGRRRPRGSLVAQSLAAHAGQPQAAILRSRRISRIAIQPALRRRGIARALVEQQRRESSELGLDFLSVSFGYTEELWQFWRACGFTLARIGSHLEASSGCYAAMALLPLSAAGAELQQRAYRQLRRDGVWLDSARTLPLSWDEARTQKLEEEDWRELAGFAFAHRPFEASLPAICRLLLQSADGAEALRYYFAQGRDMAQAAAHCGLSGRRSLIGRWRQEVAGLMNRIDSQYSAAWRSYSATQGEQSAALRSSPKSAMNGLPFAD